MDDIRRLIEAEMKRYNTTFGTGEDDTRKKVEQRRQAKAVTTPRDQRNLDFRVRELDLGDE